MPTNRSSTGCGGQSSRDGARLCRAYSTELLDQGTTASSPGRCNIDAVHPLIHPGRETEAQYALLADRIQPLVDSIVANRHLPDATDANRHYVIADLSQGALLMQGQGPERSRHDGAALVHGALSPCPASRSCGQVYQDVRSSICWRR
jgi:hypothetical protein